MQQYSWLTHVTCAAGLSTASAEVAKAAHSHLRSQTWLGHEGLPDWLWETSLLLLDKRGKHTILARAITEPGQHWDSIVDALLMACLQGRQEQVATSMLAQLSDDSIGQAVQDAMADTDRGMHIPQPGLKA